MNDDRSPDPGLVRIRVRDLKQLFNSMDPSPFVERDLDPAAETFIIDWARELPSDRPLTIAIETPEAVSTDALSMVREALGAHFQRASRAASLRLHRLLREGRISLLIGLASLFACLTLSAAVSSAGEGTVRTLLAESLVIGGWVAMWRPMEIFLYAWWPIARDRRLFRRLAVAKIDLVTRLDGN